MEGSGLLSGVAPCASYAGEGEPTARRGPAPAFPSRAQTCPFCLTAAAPKGGGGLLPGALGQVGSLGEARKAGARSLPRSGPREV